MRVTYITFIVALMATTVAGHARTTLFQKSDSVVFLGNTFVDLLREHGYLETILTARHPDHELRFRNLGWAGDTLRVQARPFNFTPLDAELAAHKGDVIVASFGMGESFAGADGIDPFKADLLKLIEHLSSKNFNGKTPPRIVLISPIACEDHGPVATPNHKVVRANLALYAQAMGEVAKQKNVTFVDVFTPTANRLETTKKKLTVNGIHFNDSGYRFVSRVIADALTRPDSWRVEVDAAAKGSRAVNTKISQVKVADDGVVFHVHDSTLPLQGERRSLVAKHLRPGTYTLMIDGRPVASHDHTLWQRGVAVVNNPAGVQVEQLRNAINDKNKRFFYRWRALNSVHIVGQRKTSPSGKDLPGELKKMDVNIKEKEKAIPPLAKPPSSQVWKLVRSGD